MCIRNKFNWHAKYIKKLIANTNLKEWFRYVEKMKIMAVVALMISSFGAAVAFAENSQNNMATNDNGRTQMLTTTNNNDNDNNNNWGVAWPVGINWLGRFKTSRA